MSHGHDTGSPEAVFARAQRAMTAGDWETFFACLDIDDLRRLAGMGLSLIAHSGSSVESIAVEHGVDPVLLEPVRSAAAAMADSSAEIRTHVDGDPQVMMAASLHHRDLVRAYDDAVDAAARTVTDLPAFVAAIERWRRDTSGGGSVSSTLFVDEQLVDVAIAGRTATGIRRRARGADETVRFVRRRDGWRVRLLGRAVRA